jgi:hypothetical protein
MSVSAASGPSQLWAAPALLLQGELDGSMEQSEMLPSVNTTRRMQQEGEEYQLLLHNGDISYARWGNLTRAAGLLRQFCMP